MLRSLRFLRLPPRQLLLALLTVVEWVGYWELDFLGEMALLAGLLYLGNTKPVADASLPRPDPMRCPHARQPRPRFRSRRFGSATR